MDEGGRLEAVSDRGIWRRKVGKEAWRRRVGWRVAYLRREGGWEEEHWLELEPGSSELRAGGEFGVGALRRAGSGEEDWRGGSMEEGHMESWKGEGRRESWHREEGGRRQGVWKLASNRAGECGI